MAPITKSFKRDLHLFHENDHSRELYIVGSGTIQVYRKLGKHEVILATLGKGAVLGEMALIDGKPRSASARTTEESSVIIIDADTFLEKIKGVPPWLMSIVRMISQKIRKANDRFQKARSDNKGINIILAMEYLLLSKTQTSFDFNKTKTRLTRLLGITNQRALSALQFLQQHGFLAISETTISLAEPEKFARYCHFCRLCLRKAFETLPQISPESSKLIHAIFDANPTLSASDQPQFLLPGTDYTALCATAEIEPTIHAIVEELRDIEKLSLDKKQGGEKSEKPFADQTLRVDLPFMIRHYLFTSFSGKVPNL